jgi:hypothetical protein
MSLIRLAGVMASVRNKEIKDVRVILYGKQHQNRNTLSDDTALILCSTIEILINFKNFETFLGLFLQQYAI